jgi:GntP family gluconate:H+ symporter
MINIGLLVAAPTAIVGMFLVGWLSRRISIPMRPLEGGRPEPEPLPDEKLPGLLPSLLPILLPVLMISAHTVVSTIAKGAEADSPIHSAEQFTSVLGNANLAMLVAAAIALLVLWRQRGADKQEIMKLVESSLMSSGVIILITSGGGAFGAMLKEAQIGPAIQNLFVSGGAEHIGGIKLLFMGFFIASLLKFAQGSTTVSMITTSAMLAALITSKEALGYHPVYLATAIGFGAQCGNWMNDSGFWIFAKMSGLTEVETLKTWTVTVSSLAVVGFGVTLLFVKIMPLV